MTLEELLEEAEVFRMPMESSSSWKDKSVFERVFFRNPGILTKRTEQKGTEMPDLEKKKKQKEYQEYRKTG